MFRRKIPELDPIEDKNLLTQQQRHSTMERFTFPSRLGGFARGKSGRHVSGERLEDLGAFPWVPSGKNLFDRKETRPVSGANTCNCLLTPFLAHSARESKRRGDRSTLGNKRRRFSFLFFFFLFPPSLFLPFPSNAAKHRLV